MVSNSIFTHSLSGERTRASNLFSGKVGRVVDSQASGRRMVSVVNTHENNLPS